MTNVSERVRRRGVDLREVLNGIRYLARTGCGATNIVGRKRHIAVDTDGRLLAVNLTTGDISDSAGAQMILTAIRKRWPWIKHLYADSA